AASGGAGGGLAALERRRRGDSGGGGGAEGVEGHDGSLVVPAGQAAGGRRNRRDGSGEVVRERVGGIAGGGSHDLDPALVRGGARDAADAGAGGGFHCRRAAGCL